MLALGGDDGLAGGLALCGVEGVWLAVHWAGDGEGEGDERAFYTSGRRRD